MIKNKTRTTILCNNKKILASVISKAIGLMFSRKIKDVGFIFVFSIPRRIDLHMFFVFYPIDVLFLDERKKVLEIKEHFMPFTFCLSKEKTSFVIELPEGTIKASGTQTGDLIAF